MGAGKDIVTLVVAPSTVKSAVGTERPVPSGQATFGEQPLAKRSTKRPSETRCVFTAARWPTSTARSKAERRPGALRRSGAEEVEHRGLVVDATLVGDAIRPPHMVQQRDSRGAETGQRG